MGCVRRVQKLFAQRFQSSSASLLVSLLCSKVISDSPIFYLEATAGVGARINYSDWFKKTCLDNRIFLKGWPDFLSHNPKELKLPHLRAIYSSIIDKQIFYRTMSSEEVAEGFHAYNAQITMKSGSVQLIESTPLADTIA